MSQQGWETESSRSFQLAGERVADPDFSVARIWHSPARITRRASDLSDSILIVIGIDGGGTVKASDGEWRLQSRQLFVADADAPVQMTFSGSFARLEVRTRRHRLGAVQLLLRRPIEVIDIEDRYWRTLASLVVTVLGAGIRAQDPGFTPLKTAIENTVTAAIVQSMDARVHGSTPVTLLTRAQQVIEERFADARFSAAELANRLAISSAHLHRIFSAASMTPYQVIQQYRANRASDLAHGHRYTRATIAALSGFSSTRAMNRALGKNVGQPRGR